MLFKLGFTNNNKILNNPSESEGYQINAGGYRNKNSIKLGKYAAIYELWLEFIVWVSFSQSNKLFLR